MTATTTTERLTPERVVRVAHDLISRHGLDWFSMRKLAAELDVNPMTVYLRFASKDELLDAVARRGLASFEPPPLRGSWDERGLALAVALRGHLVADHHMLGLYSSADRLSGAVLHAVEQGLALMEQAGHRDGDAVLAFRSFFWHIVGSTVVHGQFPANDSPDGLSAAVGTIDAATHPTFARLLPHFAPVDADQLFVRSTRALLVGLRAEGASPSDSDTRKRPTS